MNPASRPGLFLPAVETRARRSAVFLAHADKEVRKIPMIELTRLNGNRLAVNSDLIQFAEAAPDTLLTMVTGEKLLVAESLTEVAERMVAYQAQMLAEANRLLPGGFAFGVGTALRAKTAADVAEEAGERDDLDDESAPVARRRRRAAP